MLMANTLNFKQAARIESIFDIKGSKVKREVSTSKNEKKTTVLKDINFIKMMNKNPGFVNFLQGDIKKLNAIMKRDVMFLKSHKIMDFSLLLAIEKYVPESLSGSIVGTLNKRTATFNELLTPSSINKAPVDRESWNQYF